MFIGGGVVATSLYVFVFYVLVRLSSFFGMHGTFAVLLLPFSLPGVFYDYHRSSTVVRQFHGTAFIVGETPGVLGDVGLDFPFGFELLLIWISGLIAVRLCLLIL